MDMVPTKQVAKCGNCYHYVNGFCRNIRSEKHMKSTRWQYVCKKYFGEVLKCGDVR